MAGAYFCLQSVWLDSSKYSHKQNILLKLGSLEFY